MNEHKYPKLIYVLTNDDPSRRLTRIGQAGLREPSDINLPPNSGELLYAARYKAKSDMGGQATGWTVRHAETAVSLSQRKVTLFTVTPVKKVLEMSGLQPATAEDGTTGNGWYHCSPQTAINAIRAVKEGRKVLSEHEKTPWPAAPVEMKRRQEKKRKGNSHAAADAMDWDDARMIISALQGDARWRDAMLVATGCYTGLRISDSLTLRWSDVVDRDKIEIVEQKTGKIRTIRLNPAYTAIAKECYDALCIESPGEYIARSCQNGGTTHITRQRVNQIIRNIKKTYLPGRNLVFSSHTFRKTFGRRVYENECRKGRGETALMLLAEVFGHSNTNITKRYLGIRKEEILSVYDIL